MTKKIKKNKKSKKKEKSKFIIYLEYIPFRILFGIIHALPLKVGYALSAFLFRLLFLADRRHRIRTIQHVMHAGLFTDRRQACDFARRTYVEFSKLFVEMVKMDQLYSKSKIGVTGDPEAVATMVPADGSPGPQVIIACAHYGNWEVAGTAVSEQTRRPMSSFMRPFANPLIGEMILGHRAGDMHELVDKNAGIRPILRAAAAGRNLTLLIDQHASRAEAVVCEFFGHPAQVHMTPALLHLKTGIPIQPEITRRKPGANFEFELVFGKQIRYEPTDDKQKDIQNICQMCISELEKMIMEDPVQWLWTPRHWLDINRKRSAEFQTPGSESR